MSWEDRKRKRDNEWSASTAGASKWGYEPELFVRPLPDGTKSADLQSFVECQGVGVDRVRVLPAKKDGWGCVGFVRLKSAGEMAGAIEALSGCDYEGSLLTVTEARSNNSGVKSKEPCMFFREGKCTRGDKCLFSHEIEGKAKGSSADSGEGRKLEPCAFILKGLECYKGAACKFSHDLALAVAAPAPKRQSRRLQYDPNVDLPVLYEDDDIIGVNKPPGVAAHPSTGCFEGGTVAHGLVGSVPEEMMEERGDHNEQDSFIPRCMVHRLDAGTTGVLLIAKTPAAQVSLTDQLRPGADGAKTARKVYVAVLAADPSWGRDSSVIEVDGAIGREEGNSRKAAVREDGKAAKSIIRVHRRHPSGATLATVVILTGRMHQIRVHSASVGAPVIGDTVYGTRWRPGGGGAVRAAADAAATAHRPLLHSWALDVDSPQGKTAAVRAALPDDIWAVISKLWPSISRDPALWGRRCVALVDRNSEGRR